MKKLFKVILALVLVTALFASCAQEKERVFRVNMAPTYTGSIQILMKERGTLEKYLPEGVTVEWSNIATGPDMRDALISNNIDIAEVAFLTYISAYEQGLPLVPVSNGLGTNVCLFSKDPELISLEQIPAESRIAITNKGTTLHTAFLALCKEELGDALIYDNNLVSISAADALVSLQSGDEFDLAIFSFPNLIKASEIEGLTMIADMSDVIQEYGVGSVLTTRADYYEKNEDIINAFVQAQRETVAFMNDHPDEAAAILGEYFGVDKEAIQDLIIQLPPQIAITSYDKQAQLLYDAGILTKEPTPFEELPNYDKLPK